MFYFLMEDFGQLEKQIQEVCERIRKIGEDMGKSCQQGAETFHDNFAHEEGARQQYMWSNKLRELIRVRNSARVVTPNPTSDKVSIGKKVTIIDESSGQTKTLRVGSFMVFSKDDTISYNAPLARLLMGAKIGERVEGIVGDKVRSVLVVDVK